MSRFNIPLQELADKVKLDLETVARQSTQEIFKAVSLIAPVDHGQYRANMNVTHNFIDRTTTESTDQSRMQTEIDKANTFPIGGITYMCNSLPYATVLEYGGYPKPPKRGSKVRVKGAKGGKGDPKWTYVIKSEGGYSRQAPQGVFRITVMKFNDYVKKAISK